MAVTTTASLSSIWQSIRDTYSQFSYKRAKTARWSPDETTVYFLPIRSSEDYAYNLHELGHALCGHSGFTQDIDLLGLEREAWDRAAVMAGHYDTAIVPSLIEASLDSYREWMHTRSRCPHCRSAGIQQKVSLDYSCPLCGTRWHTNDARQCELRRFVIQKPRSL